MIEVMDKLWLGLVLQSLVLLSIAWRGCAAVDSSLTGEQYLMHKEDEVRLLANDALRLALDRQDCGLSQCSRRCSRHACSPITTDNLTCVSTVTPILDCGSSCDRYKLDFGRKDGYVRLPPFFRNFSNSNLSPEIKRSICAHSSLQFPVRNDAGRTLRYVFGSAEGVSRAYPGQAENPEKDCINFDPRKQPGYILSTSVVKDLVVLLDVGQKNGTTFMPAKNIITELFDTFGVGDSVNVVTFDSTSATILQPSSVSVKSNADVHSAFDVASVVNNPSSFSNLSRGFEKAMSTFNSTSKLKIMVVVTDGYFSQAVNFHNTPPLEQTVSLLNSEGVVVFFFSLGPGDGENPPNPLMDLRRFSCRLNSSVTYVSIEDAVRNPLWAIRPYFDYQATLRFKKNLTFWTNVHEATNGGGNMVTANCPVFENGTLFGVASIDVPVSSTDVDIIKKKYVDPNVLPVRLACQMQQVKLNQCTKLLDSAIRSLCEQSSYVGESPASTYKKTLCCDSCDAFTNKSGKVNQLRIYIGLGAAGAFLVVLVCVVAILVCKYMAAQSPVQKMKEDFAKASVSTCLYTFKDLKRATCNFREDKKLGEGGLGEVYLGRFKDGLQVAVKKLPSNHSKEGKCEFLADVINISKAQHRNLVKLRGFCVERSHRLLVYEYLEKRSLRQTLLGKVSDSEHIDWSTRFKIVTGTARGLQYLHNEFEPQILHGDIKASNILLDANLDAKISDFGLVKLCPDDKTNFTKNLAGTMGYMAPEYIMRGQLTEKVDIFSFGVLLMEIVTGKLTTSRSRSGTMHFLLDEVRNAYMTSLEKSNDEHLFRLVDARLVGKYDRAEVLRVLKVALLSTMDSPTIRAPISEVLLMLIGSQEVPEHHLQEVGTRGDHSRSTSVQSSPDLSCLQWWEDDLSDPPLLVERPPKRIVPVSTSVD